MQCIYVDVLVVLNWYVDYFILLGTARVAHIGFKRKRVVLSALLGACSSLMILLPTMHYVVNVAVRFAVSVVLVVVAFGRGTVWTTVKTALYFCVVSFTFAGMAMALRGLTHGSVVSTNNGYVYADVSIPFLVASTAVCYATLCGVRYVFDRNAGTSGSWTVEVTYLGRRIVLEGLADTGNALTDAFSGRPVVVCSQRSLEEILPLTVPPTEAFASLRGFRLVPYSTIGGDGLVPSFKPDSVVVVDSLTGRSKAVDALIGVSGDADKAIFNPKVLA